MIKKTLFILMLTVSCLSIYSNGQANCEGNCYNGVGKYSFASGNSYDGEWKNDKKHGQGIFYWKNGERFEGRFKNDRMHHGTYYYSGGNIYVGDFSEEEKKDGKGVFYWKNGEKFEGLFKSDKMNHGTYYYLNGNKYVGGFSHQERKQGKGVFYWKSGGQFDGFFKNDNMHDGTYYYSNGNKYVGSFNEKEKKEGNGVFYWKDGDRFEGFFKNGKMNQGTYYYTNQNKYVGGFNAKEKRHGKGIFYYANGKIKQGIWENGTFIRSEIVTINKVSPSVPQKPTPQRPQTVLIPHKKQFGRYYALVIGNNHYKYLPNLKTAINDAKTVANLLKKDYHFTVNLITDATRSDILRAFNKARRTLTKKDNLLVYYAGHGWLDEDADQGYWLPVDAEEDSNIDWISNATITDTLRAMSAKHVMLVADSCYSGKLTRGLKLSIKTSDYLTRLAKKKARTVLTSGGLEPVMDAGGGKNSVFARAFIDALSENQEVLDGHKLFSIIRRPVMLNSDQTPEYSDIRKSGHGGGDFLFVK